LTVKAIAFSELLAIIKQNDETKLEKENMNHFGNNNYSDFVSENLF
jgi:hypothetical protein